LASIKSGLAALRDFDAALDRSGSMLLKSPEIPSGDFFERNEAKLFSPINIGTQAVVEAAGEFSLGDEVPSHIYPRIASAA